MTNQKSGLISRILTTLLGKVSWQSPVWLSQGSALCKANARFVIGLGVTLIALIILSGIYYWYEHLPKPPQIIANITPPSPTPVDKVLKPQSLLVNFGIQTVHGWTPASVAPLANIGKPITQGIHVKPTLAGNWLWKSDQQLVFYPEQDWPADQKYSITFDKTLFSKSSKLGNYQYSFATQPFTVAIENLKFYQDLENPKHTQVIATLHFNFPVDTESLQQHTQLNLQELKNEKLNLSAQSYKYTLSYDEHKRTAYLRSEDIPPTASPRYLDLLISKGVLAVGGHATTAESNTSTILIPDAGSFMSIAKIGTQIVRDSNDRPQQLLTVETSLGVSNPALQQHIQVFLLPKNRPATQLEPIQENYTWQEPGEITDQVLSLSKPVDLTALPEEHPLPPLHSWQFSADTPGFLYVKITPGVKGAGDFILTKPYQTIVPIAEMPREIKFLHKGALISLSGEKKLTVLLRGVPLVKFSIARVLPTEINHLVSQTSGNFQNPAFVAATFTRDDISEIFTEKREFNIASPGELQYTTLDFERLLTADNTAVPLGLFLVKAQGWDKKSDTPSGVENNRLILITDMGILVKNNSDGTHDLFVQSISQGTPVANAQIQLLGRNGLPIVQGISSADGHFQLPLLDNYKNEQQPTVYVVKNGNDISFMPYDRADRQLNFSRFDISGISDEAQGALSAFLFSDRGLYRPGDLIHVGMLVKQKFVNLQPAGLPLKAVITDPRGVTVMDQKMSLPESGLLTLDYRPDNTAPTGTYTISLYLIKDGQWNKLLGSTEVRVEEFLPDRLQAHAQFLLGTAPAPMTKGWLMPQELNAQLQVNNLYGTPAAGRRVTAKIVLAPHAFYFPNYGDYNFIDPLLDPKKPPKVFSESLTDTHTNEHGEAQFALNLQRFAKATYKLTFITEAFEADGGRGVSTQISTLVTPLAYLVGYKPDGDLAYLKKNSQYTVRFIAINSSLQKIPANQLKMQILSVQTVATLVKNPDGSYKYQSIKQETHRNEQPFNISETGSDFMLPTENIGDYALALTDHQGNILSKLYFSVVGDSGHPLQKNAELAVKLAKNEYNPGDTIEMQITAPYVGSGLISIERDKVYSYKWFKTDSNNSLQTIQIPADFEGNGYITIVYVRDWAADEIFVSPLSYSVIPFTVNRAAHTVHIGLETPKLVKPGTNLSISYQTDIPAKIIVFAVDQGILQVADYLLPDPLGYFFRKRALGVSTAQIVDQILPKYIANREASAIGGDHGEKALASNINPFKRKTEAPVAYWSGILDSDNTLRTVAYQVPDYFNGNIRIMAVAVAPNAVGSAKNATTVRGDFVISPNVPNFVAPGDTFIVTANIANNLKETNATQPVQISLITSPGLAVSGDTQQSVIIPPGQERSVSFEIRAKAVLGNATLQFHAQQQGHHAQYETTLSVRPASAFQTSLISGSDQSSSKNIAITRQLYPQYRLLQAMAATNPLILVQGLQGYLQAYPYNCTEQLISTAFSQLAIAKQPLFNLDPQQMRQALNSLLQILRQRLNDKGGFSYWPGQGDNTLSQFATVYAMDFLTEAKLQGYVVPQDLMEDGLRYLQNLVTQDAQDLTTARLHAYAIYILTRNEIVTTNYLTHLQLFLNQKITGWQNDLTSIYLAATYQLLKNDNEGARLLHSFSLDKPTSDEDSFYNPLIAKAQYITLLARHFPKQLQALGGAPIMALTAGISGNQLNTLSAAYSAIALSSYAQATSLSGEHDKLSISEVDANKNIKPLISHNMHFQQVDFSPQATQIVFYNPDQALYFYQIQQSGFNSVNPKQPINNGLEVYREYRDLMHQPINQVNLGDDIESHIQIRNLANQTSNNVAIVDLFPGGFDVVRNSVQKGNCDYVDVREDRVIFYCSASADATELSYKLRAVNEGTFTTAPIMAQDMYKQSVQSTGVEGSIVIK